MPPIVGVVPRLRLPGTGPTLTESANFDPHPDRHTSTLISPGFVSCTPSSRNGEIRSTPSMPRYRQIHRIIPNNETNRS
ncbi:hypothetical protein GWI33_021947 [Rhynchophorus ferrugineus]|uniref:Uncharacterized protein n=1 Tax=Rhynchophorus ferrugineus TaxID=354439 RepID=A0A834MJC6_RHYFE|nr:hypothetical protein GWI33_021947 [Rhynchophorus ferrugineus]